MATPTPTTNLPQAMIETVVPASDWVIVLPIALALMGAAGLMMFRRSNGAPLIGAVIVVLAIIACEIALLLEVLANGPVSMTMGRWLPPFGISLTADLFGASFALAAAVVTLIVLFYAELDRADADGRDAFHPMVLLLLAGVTGAFLTGDLFNLYVWFEVMLIASFGLIVQGNRPLQLDGAVKYGFLNFLATTFFLMSLGLLYGLLGTLNMSDIMRVSNTADPAAMAGVAALFLLAFGMKAAAFPVNAWLPASYHTPPAAISALFAGLLTKVGAYAMLRALVVVLPASRDMLEPVLACIAIGTLLIAPLGAIAETNLRRAIGFVVIGGIGAVIAGLSMPSLNGVAGSGLYIFHAILTMTALYMVAGLVEKTTGQTDTRQMGGLYAASAPLSILFILLVLASAGVPPFLGFWPKLLLLEAGLDQGVTGTAPGWVGTTMVLALLINAVLTLIAGTRLWAHVFWRSGPEGQGSENGSVALKPFDKRGQLALGATTFLVVGIMVAGLWPGPLMEGVSAGAADILDPARYVEATGLAGDEL
ncbi:multicomponent Na+:H+ antiporter subunit D [Devosia subaequoris]|uniref:Multicomponent Na+:H+ antiporter subunit D n=1 Tax=Devosia subaequoris TaxID=395930 RepID=A0A7W6NAW8_9HYPH|nr:proton-conducting transporter membrane subunit [Devosia subaequoris]MBB4051086.1 multicomponent Na+:H+ antiporter subunit D [Devosia subaequoris]MCP1208248.1 Na+/H+ antiporter subunit D [Devosia subaequoris]